MTIHHYLDPQSRFQQKLIEGDWTATLELSPPRVGDELDSRRFQSDLSRSNGLIEQGVFDGATLRDAPPFGRLSEQAARIVKRGLTYAAESFPRIDAGFVRTARELLNEIQCRQDPQAIVAPINFVATIAAQTRSEEIIINKIDAAVNKQNAAAVFAISGGDPRRRIYEWLNHLSPEMMDGLAKLSPTYFSAPLSSLDIARLIKDAQTQGKIPDNVMIWGVWDHTKEPNPAIGGEADALRYFAKKVDAGMQVFLTNPPFNGAQFNHWHEAIRQDERFGHIKIKIGVPYLLSARNLGFWYLLTGTDRFDPEAHALMAQFERAEHDNELGKFRRDWNRQWISYLAGIGDGVHFMPQGMREAVSVYEEALRDARYKFMPAAREQGWVEELQREVAEWLTRLKAPQEFAAGALFGEMAAWWKPGTRRAVPHEGVDIMLSPGTPIPAFKSGRTAHIIPHAKEPGDFKRGYDVFGETIITEHDITDGNGRRLISLLGHVQRDDDGTLSVANPPPRYREHAHLHISLGWVEANFDWQDITWKDITLGNGSRISLFDPLGVSRPALID